MGTLIYRAGKADEQRWQWDPADPDFDVAYAVETETDWPWQIFLSRYAAGSHTALRALVYAFLKRDDDRLRIESVQVKYGDVDYEADKDEVAKPASGEPEPKGKKKKAGEQGEA